MPYKRIREALGSLLPWSQQAEGALLLPARVREEYQAPVEGGLPPLIDSQHLAPGESLDATVHHCADQCGCVTDDQGRCPDPDCGCSCPACHGRVTEDADVPVEQAAPVWPYSGDADDQLDHLMAGATTRGERKEAVRRLLAEPHAAAMPPALRRLLVARGYASNPAPVREGHQYGGQP